MNGSNYVLFPQKLWSVSVYVPVSAKLATLYQAVLWWQGRRCEGPRPGWERPYCRVWEVCWFHPNMG